MTRKKEVERAAKRYLKTIGGDTRYLNVLQGIAYLGWEVYLFNGENDEGDPIIESLELTEYAKNKPSFLATDDKHRFIFIRAHQPEDEATFCLLHEIGHIMLRHQDYRQHIINATAIEEAEANLFARYALTHTHGRNRRRRRTVIVVILAALLIAYYQTDKEKQRTPAYFVEGGTNYHKQVCTYTAGKDTVLETNIKEAEQLGLEPCPVCQTKLE